MGRHRQQLSLRRAVVMAERSTAGDSSAAVCNCKKCLKNQEASERLGGTSETGERRGETSRE